MVNVNIPLLVTTKTNVGNAQVSPDGSSVIVNFSPEIQIPVEASNINLSMFSFTGTNSFPNIGQALTGHYQFIWSDDLANTTKYFVDFPEGDYSVEELNTQLNREIANKYPALTSPTNPLFTLKANTATNKLDLYINAVGYFVNHNALTSITVNPGGFIGGTFSPAGPALTTTAESSYEGALSPVFGKVTEINVNCDLGGAGQRINGANSYLLGTVALTGFPPSSQIEFFPAQSLQITVPGAQGQKISRMRVFLTQQDFQALSTVYDWNTEIQLSYQLPLRIVPEYLKL